MSKKVGIGLAVVVIGIIAATVVYLSTQAGAYVARLIEDYGRATTGTDVSVGGVTLALADGRGRVGNLTIGNPGGFSTDYFLRVRDIDLTLDLGSLGTQVPVVRVVVVDGAHLNAEQHGDATNLTDIQRHMTASSAPEQPAEQGRVIIDRFRLVNSRVTLTSELLSKPEDLPLDEVVVSDIGRRAGGVSYDEATQAVLAPILGAARTAVQRRLREAAGDAARDELRERASERLKELTEN